jgi:hypothetical protein
LRTIPLYELTHADGRRAYGVDEAAAPAGFTRAAAPIAYVWPSPVRVKLPVADFLGDVVADAGPDRCVTEAEHGAGADITLDGSRSRSLAGPIAGYTWRVLDAAGCRTQTGASVTVHAATGLTTIVLEVRDAAGHTASATVMVQVTGA